MSLVHGGGGFHILSQSVFQYIGGTDLADIIAPSEEVSDYEATNIIDKVTLYNSPCMCCTLHELEMR